MVVAPSANVTFCNPVQFFSGLSLPPASSTVVKVDGKFTAARFVQSRKLSFFYVVIPSANVSVVNPVQPANAPSPIT